MSCRKIFQSRSFLLIFCLISLLLILIHYKRKYFSLNLKLNKKKENFILKIFEINDREPTFKLAAYEGYQFPLARNRAQTKLINTLKLYQICQQYPNTTVVDVGASLGEFGLYAAACGCYVYMFEIEKNKISFIEKSIELNSFESRIHLIKKAVSDIKSNLTIYFSKNSSSQLPNSINITMDNQDIYMGETINLNQQTFISSIFLLRVDVQGHELHVFRSFEKLFYQKLIDHVIFEYTSWGTPKTIQKDIFDYMKHILGAKQFYALHTKQPIIYGPLNDQDLRLFYSQHSQKHLQRDIYVYFRDEEIIFDTNPYDFQASFKK